MPFLNVKNRAESTLASGISDSDLSLTVAAGEGVKFPAANFHITIEDEILLCSSRADDVLTVEREKEGTTAAAHEAGKTVELRITARIIEEIREAMAGNPFDDYFYWQFLPNGYPAFWTKSGPVTDDAGKLELDPTEGNVAYVYKKPIFRPFLSWEKDIKAAFYLKEYYWATGDWYLVVGYVPGKYIGFKKVVNKLYGVVHDGVSETTVEIGTVAQTWLSKELSFVYTAGEKVVFSVTGYSDQEISTGLPTGGSATDAIIYIKCDATVADTRLGIGVIKLYWRR